MDYEQPGKVCQTCGGHGVLGICGLCHAECNIEDMTPSGLCASCGHKEALCEDAAERASVEWS